MKNYSIIGGDLRIVNLAKLLAKDDNKVNCYGFENTNELENIQNISICNDIDEAINNSDIVISSVPLTKNGTDIYMPFSSKTVKIEELLEKIFALVNGLNGTAQNTAQRKFFIAGAIPKDVLQQFENKNLVEEIKNPTNIDNESNLSKEKINKENINNIKIIDLMQNDELTILNTIATAEGAISDIVTNTDFNLHGSKVLILGFGRVSKVLAKKLKALDANVTCAARKESDFAWMEALGYNVANINLLGKNNLANEFDSLDKKDDVGAHLKSYDSQNLNQYDIIINTVPTIILDKEKLQYVNKNCFLLDLASKPGGFDQEYISENKLNYKWSLAIPGKVAPVTSAMYIKNTIDNILKKEEV